VLVAVDRNATVSIVDHGEGVTAEDRQKVFEPFWRKNENTVGTGLGLAIAKELIEKLGGRIWVENTPGGGAMGEGAHRNFKPIGAQIFVLADRQGESNSAQGRAMAQT